MCLRLRAQNIEDNPNINMRRKLQSKTSIIIIDQSPLFLTKIDKTKLRSRKKKQICLIYTFLNKKILLELIVPFTKILHLKTEESKSNQAKVSITKQ